MTKKQPQTTQAAAPAAPAEKQKLTTDQALMNAVVRQRDDALAKLVHADAATQMLMQDNERLTARVAELEAASAAK